MSCQEFLTCKGESELAGILISLKAEFGPSRSEEERRVLVMVHRIYELRAWLASEIINRQSIEDGDKWKRDMSDSNIRTLEMQIVMLETSLTELKAGNWEVSNAHGRLIRFTNRIGRIFNDEDLVEEIPSEAYREFYRLTVQ